MFGEKKGPLSPEEMQAIEKAKNDAQDAEYAEMVAEYERLDAPPEVKKEGGPEVAKFQELITAFEQEHSLEELHLIIDLIPKEAPMHPVREPARKAIAPIFAQLKVLRKEADISSKELDEVEQDYRRISQAVGIINKNRVDHTR